MEQNLIKKNYADSNLLNMFTINKLDSSLIKAD